MIRQEGVFVKCFSLGDRVPLPVFPKQGGALLTTQLEQFRQQLYASVSRRADALIEVVDALSSNATARSVVELSLNPCFRHGYGSLYDAIDHFFQSTSPQQGDDGRGLREQQIMRLIVPLLPVPHQRTFWLLGVDVTPVPRPFADTLEDRGFVYHPNTVRGNRPVTIGHQYSALVALPEKAHRTDPPWVVPLSLRRVGSQELGTLVGARQVETVLADETLPFGKALCVMVADSAYTGVPVLGRVAPHQHLVTITRLRGNRTLYRSAPPPTDAQRRHGHPTWYGPPFKLREPTTWGAPDETATTGWTTKHGRPLIVYLEAWHDLLLRGTNEVPMYRYPFTLLRARVVDTEGNLVFQRPFWLIAIGNRRRDVSLVEAWESFGRRYDLEHFFRFGKQRLLATTYQTPDVEHEENWWQIIQLAYTQLWLARALAHALPRHWERSLPHPAAGIATPTTVQRNFGRILRQLGTPAAMPKLRGNAPGRARGQRQRRRERQPVIKKDAAPRKKAQAAT